MKIRELFKSTGLSQSIGGTSVFLDRDNCQIVNKTKNGDSVRLGLKRESDGEEGHAYLRAKDEFKDISAQLLNWAFASQSLTGLTLNQLEDLETGLTIEKSGGKVNLKQ